MDAPTTTSADGDRSGGNGRDGGWFGRSPGATTATRTGSGTGEQSQDAHRDEGGRIPSRPVTPIRPVGSGAERSRTATEAPAPAAPAPASAPSGSAPVPAADPEGERIAAAPEDTSDGGLLRRTMAEIEPIADKVTSHFYALLFLRHPDLRALFPAAMDTQRDRLFKALLTAATHVENTAVLTAYLTDLGRGHRKYGTLPEHYPAVGEALIGALSRYATQSWGPRTEAAWVGAYTAISQIMIDAAAKDELRAPAWWQAEVVSHDMRTRDVAVVTLRPDAPYPFLAGQYAAVETSWWPRVWRNYSFASAPRSDGLLSFHVKAVPAGWVSNALVHRARPGDVIRIGPPTGSMTVDHTTDNGLLCLGGGTGIAPIKALVEDVARHGRRRSVQVFYGARRDHDLYDIDTMLRMQQSHPWLSVRPVVDDGPGGDLCGRLPDAVCEYGPWHTYDAYLSGPPGMIRRGVDTLVGIGIPTHRIRHDSIEELVGARN
ncbi:globin domain-containing protein [Streptomyces sp. NPDC059989]|uniref:globin domain-containing protein n=1 Tax=Streptomyces sp. NPDC059989 TaxID=3347026 RepID=UPI0036AB6B31